VPDKHGTAWVTPAGTGVLLPAFAAAWPAFVASATGRVSATQQSQNHSSS
jgi:hypothetical protein